MLEQCQQVGLKVNKPTSYSIQAVPVRVPNPLKNLIEWLVAFVSSSSPNLDAGDRPAVVFRNGHGAFQRVLETETFDEALQGADRLKEELEAIGLDKWCKRYGIPEDSLNRRKR
jgi:hypothetical protein